MIIVGKNDLKAIAIKMLEKHVIVNNKKRKRKMWYFNCVFFRMPQNVKNNAKNKVANIIRKRNEKLKVNLII
ncbi:MAG: hypothetical protein HFJ42_02480 [Clostridia bacterium]|nr:hypothetical protein [Clostridia bacterium]